MRLDGNFIEDLFIESHSARDAPNGRQQFIIKPLSPAQPAALRIKGQPRHEGQIQPGQFQGRTTFGWLANPEPPIENVAVKVPDTAGDVTIGREIEPGQRDRFAGSQRIFQHRQNVQLLRQGRVEEN